MRSPQSTHLLRRWAPRCVLQTLRVLHPCGNGEVGCRDTVQGAGDIEDTLKEDCNRGAGPPQSSAAAMADRAAYDRAVHVILVAIPGAAESRCWAEAVQTVCDFLDASRQRGREVGPYRLLLVVPMLWALADAVLRCSALERTAAMPAVAELLARLALERHLPPSIQVAAAVLAIAARPPRARAWIGAAHEATTTLAVGQLATFFARFVTPRQGDHSSG